MCVCVCVVDAFCCCMTGKKKKKKKPFPNVSLQWKTKYVCLIQLLFKWADEAAGAGSGPVGSPDDYY